MKPPFVSLSLCALLFFFSTSASGAAHPALVQTAAAQDDADLVAFEHLAAAVKAKGFTHLAITTGLPPSLWQFQPPGDPYPGWFVNNASLLKIFPPAELRPFVDVGYAHRVQRILAARGKVLKKFGLKGQWDSDEPQTLPEAFFTAYPQLRGPRVDQPNRARAPRFAPCVDRPEVLKLYREALQDLWAICPEVDSFSFLTSDSGSGFGWVPALYAGINGNSDFKDRPMADRVAGFMKNFQAAADPIHLTVSVSLNPIQPRSWMTATFSPEVLASIVRELPRGMAVSGHEGPDGRAFHGLPRTGYTSFGGAFYPVVGLPSALLRPQGSAGNIVERAQSRRRAAVAEVGEANADDFVAIEDALSDATVRLDTLNFGDMLRFGTVLARWIDRPMVPFPAELDPEEKEYYYPYLFQARSPAQADDLVDIQGMLMYRGWGAKMLFHRVIETTLPDVQRATEAAQRIAARAKDQTFRHAWHENVLRLEAITCLLKSADHMVSYQAYLDRVHALHLKPEYDPPLGLRSDWARTDMLALAREEIDNTVHLRELLQEADEPIIDTAPTAGGEYDMRLGPDLPNQLKRKIGVMNAHWEDYARIFTPPNL
ncbi:MAG: hypothetical protein ACREFX_05225 [Opitutaceae bacterium]